MIIAPFRDDLDKIVVLNPKGGCGKTTLATNLASFFALHGPAPTLIDTDPRGYSTRWLERRPPDRPHVIGIADNELSMRGKRTWSLRVPKSAGTVIVDTPAALDPEDISELTYDADCILIPILPSAFDVHVTTSFIAQLLLLTDLDRPIGVVANRTRKNTKSLAMLERTLDAMETPTVAVLRDAQCYVHAADLGLGIYDLPKHMVTEDLAQMNRIVEWLELHTAKTLEPNLLSRLNPLRKPHKSLAQPPSQSA